MNKTTKPNRKRTLPAKSVNAATSFAELQSLEQFQIANSHIFPSMPSLRWFYRQNKEELNEAGAIVELAGRLLIHAEIFPKVVIEIGRRAAAKRIR